MKIVIAPDSFKESLSAMQVAMAIRNGFMEVFGDAQYVLLPMADGGEGTVDAMVDASHGQRLTAQVKGPLGEPVTACYGWLEESKTAVIEMAAASGLHLVPPIRRNPLHTSTFGTGELILTALERGAQKIILGIGGSATNDGGAGMMAALGAQLQDDKQQSLAPGGAALQHLAHIELSGLDSRLAQTDILVACDVNNPLCGDKGASAIFGPQKGATPEMVRQLDSALRHYGEMIEQTTGSAVLDVPGAGAAGGMGAALFGLLNARLQPGIEIVTEALDLDSAVRGATLVITGEGRIDSQTIHGKTPAGVAMVAQRHGVPVIALAGSMSEDYDVVHQHGLDAVFSVLPRITSLPDALLAAEDNIKVAARNIAMVWKLAKASRS